MTHDADIWERVDLEQVRAARRELIESAGRAAYGGRRKEALRLEALIVLSREWEETVRTQRALPAEQRDMSKYQERSEG